MQKTQLATALACLLASAACPGTQLPLANSELGSADPKPSAEHAGKNTCPDPSGRYDALFEPRSGTCGEVEMPNQVPIGDEANTVTLEKSLTFDVVTETAIEGCTLNLKQTVRGNSRDLVMSVVEGAALEINSAGVISGEVTLTRYDADETESCTGEYLLELHKVE